jgi:hypothetical protein
MTQNAIPDSPSRVLLCTPVNIEDDVATPPVPEGHVLLMPAPCNTTATSVGFAVDAIALGRRSAMLCGVLGLDDFIVARGAAPSSEAAAALEQHLVETTGDALKRLPLDASAAEPRLVQLLATWLNRHRDIEPSLIQAPLPSVVNARHLFSDEFDYHLLCTASPIVRIAVGDTTVEPHAYARLEPTDPMAVFRLGLLADAVGCADLKAAAATFVVHFLKALVNTSLNPTAVTTRWLSFPSPTAVVEGATIAEQSARIEKWTEDNRSHLRAKLQQAEEAMDEAYWSRLQTSCEWLTRQCDGLKFRDSSNTNLSSSLPA